MVLREGPLRELKFAQEHGPRVRQSLHHSRVAIGHIASAEAHPAAGYARPHDLDLGRTDDGGGLWATLIEVNTTGGTVKLELNDDEGRLIQAQLSRDAYAALSPTAGERLYVKPRTLRVFLMEDKD